MGTVRSTSGEAQRLHPEACEDLLEALRMLSGADAVRVIVITGAGRAFCAGADLGVLGTQGDQLVKAGRTSPSRSATPPSRAGGRQWRGRRGGANLALACDYRLASDQASIGQVFHKLGLGRTGEAATSCPSHRNLESARAGMERAHVPAVEAAQLGCSTASCRTRRSAPKPGRSPSAGWGWHRSRSAKRRQRCTAHCTARWKKCSTSKSQIKQRYSPLPKHANS